MMGAAVNEFVPAAPVSERQQRPRTTGGVPVPAGPSAPLLVGRLLEANRVLAQLIGELHHQARHDPLTGLPNRRHLLERIDAAIAAAGEDDIGLCFADLDHFKEVNDRFGHGTGDQVLAVVADRLRDSVRGSDCMIARIGGDEFVALIPPPADDARIRTIANLLLTALAEPIVVAGHPLRLSASIGAVLTAVAGAHAEALLDAADTGLYEAKSTGKGRWILSIR